MMHTLSQRLPQNGHAGGMQCSDNRKTFEQRYARVPLLDAAWRGQIEAEGKGGLG